MSRKVESVSVDRVYQGYLAVDRHRLRHETFAGGLSDEVQREVVERGVTAAVLPYDPVRDEVVLIEQFRPGAWAAGHDPWLVEIVAGVIEDGETPEAMATREAEEEAGLTLSDFKPVAGIFLTPGICTEFCHIFCARCDTGGAGGVFGHEDEGEDIRATVHPADGLPDMLASGRLANAITVVAAQWLLLHRDDLRRAWT